MKRYLLAMVAVLVCGAMAAAQQGEGLSAFEKARQEVDLQRQRTLAKIDEALGGIEKLVAAERFADAQMQLGEAGRLIKTANYLSDDERAALTLEHKRLSELYQARKSEYLRVREDKANAEMTDRERQRRLAEQLFSERRSQSQWARLRQFRDQREYEQAVDEARALLKVNPNDNAARVQLQELESLMGAAEGLKIHSDRKTEAAKILNDIEASAVPYYELYRYPDVKLWELLSERRLTDMARRLGFETGEAETRLNLYKRVDLKMNGVSLANVMTYLTEAAGVPIITDPHLKADTGKSLEEETVTIEGRNLTLEQALGMVLPQEMGWRVDEDHIVISSREKANPLKTIVYPIQHMVAEVPDFGKTVPSLTLAEVLQQGTSGGGGGGGASLFADTTVQEDTGRPEQKIIDLITRFVKGSDRVAAWESEGGPATIDYYNGSLIINQTEEGHRKVIALLNQL